LNRYVDLFVMRGQMRTRASRCGGIPSDAAECFVHRDEACGTHPRIWLKRLWLTNFYLM